MGILGANYPQRTSSSSSMRTTTVVAQKSYKVNLVSNKGTKTDVYTAGSTTAKSTYQIPKKSASTTTTSTTNKNTTTSTATARRTTLQNCIPCGYGTK